jgi:carbonic anhydrase
MENSFEKVLQGYHNFRKKYALGDESVMEYLAYYGQKPRIMMVACCDSRVDPALILQCDPGDLFVVRNVANIVPPYEIDKAHHGTSAALEFGVRVLEVENLILLGHSQCGGIQALLENSTTDNDFISNWVSLIKSSNNPSDPDDCAKHALNVSYQNCMTFPWINAAVKEKKLTIRLWYFDIKMGQIFTYSESENTYQPL